MEYPIATSDWIADKTGLTPTTANTALGHLENLGAVKRSTAQRRNRLFSCAGYMVDVNFVSYGVRRIRTIAELLPLVSGSSTNRLSSSGIWKSWMKLSFLGRLVGKLVILDFTI